MTLSVVIIGAGRMGRHHQRVLSAMDGVRVIGVADVRREAAQALAAEAGAEAAGDDYRELLARLRPDVAYLCTPAFDHAEQIGFAAERKINIVVEKPLATTMAEGQAIVDAVERHGVICAVAYQWRYNPATDAARAALAELPITMLAGWWYWTIPPVGWIADMRWGGGQIFDQATHLIDLMRDLAGDITSVYAAYARNAIAAADLPNWDANALTLRFAGGQVGSLHTTYALFPGIPQGNGLDVVARELMARIELGRSTIFRRGAEPLVTTAPEGWNINHAIVPALQRNEPAAIRSSAREAFRSLAVTLAANYAAVVARPVDLADFVANPPDPDLIMPNQRPVFD